MVIFFKFWILWCLLFVETRRTDGKLVFKPKTFQPVPSLANVDVIWYKDNIHYSLYLAAASVLFKKLELTTNYTEPKPPRQCAKTSDFIKSNLIKDDAEKLSYCYPSDEQRKLQKRSLSSPYPDGGHDNFDCIVNNLRIAAQNPQVSFVHHLPVQTYNTVNYPYREIILQDDIGTNNRPISIPLYLRATILESHTRNVRPQIPSHINRYLERVGRFSDDQAGHLLAHVLGGTSRDEFNFVPQAARLNTHRHGWSMWLGEEIAMRDFLRREPNRNRRVEWELLLQRSPASRYPLRPDYFTFRYFYYDNNVLVDSRNRDQCVPTPEPVVCFSNDPDEECPLAPFPLD